MAKTAAKMPVGSKNRKIKKKAVLPGKKSARVAEKESAANNNNNNNNNNDVSPSSRKPKGKLSPGGSRGKMSPSGKNSELDPLVIDVNVSPVAGPVSSSSGFEFSTSPDGSFKEGEFKYKCKVCLKSYPNRYYQRKHMLMEHEDQLYECRVCSFTSVDPEKLKSHIIRQHVMKKEKADSAAVTAGEIQNELQDLISQKTPRKMVMEDGLSLGRDSRSSMRFLCDACDRVYTSRYSLERHMRCHTGEKPFKCDVCDFATSYQEHMGRHMKSVHLIVHSSEPRLKYKPPSRSPKVKTEEKNVGTEDLDEPSSDPLSLDASFGSNTTLNSIGKVRRNIQRQRFECAACGMKSTHKIDLVSHIREKHPNAHVESLNNKDGSKVHMIVTVPKKRPKVKKTYVTCQFCSKIFHDSWKFKMHLRSHTGVKPYQCSVCPFAATNKMTVRDHIHRRHTDVDNPRIQLRVVGLDGGVEFVEIGLPEREFKCNFCEEVFSDNYLLKQHKKAEHFEALPFSCTICGHREAARAVIVMHCLDAHPGEAPLDELILRNNKPVNIGTFKLPTCDTCEKMFAYQSQLYIHQKQHTGERSLRCDLCSYTTNSKLCFEKHMVKKHISKKVIPGKKSKEKIAKKIQDTINGETPLAVDGDSSTKKRKRHWGPGMDTASKKPKRSIMVPVKVEESEVVPIRRGAKRGRKPKVAK